MPGGQIRSDLSCTVFLSDPDSYEGGHLHIQYGDSDLRFKLRPGEVVVYPSDTMHEVEPVTKGERLVAVTFIQSLVPDPFQRNLLYNLNEVAALEGLNMTQENFMQLQLIQNQLLRYWGEKP
jgi:PKHD-type hydroxylase